MLALKPHPQKKEDAVIYLKIVLSRTPLGKFDAISQKGKSPSEIHAEGDSAEEALRRLGKIIDDSIAEAIREYDAKD